MAEAEPRAQAPQTSSEAPPAADGQREAGVDVRKLADKVYRLMLAEVRLERARGRPAVRQAKR